MGSKINRRCRSYALALGVALICLSILVSCSILMRPPHGVEERFFQYPDGDDPVPVAAYDFSRLQQGYGLVVFSYEFSTWPNDTTERNTRSHKKGIRVWEYKFEPSDWDVKYEKRRFMYAGYRPLQFLGLVKVGSDAQLWVTFHKGEIVYGGRLIVDAFNPDNTVMEFKYDEDFKDWLAANADKLAGVAIDTVLIQPHTW